MASCILSVGFPGSSAGKQPTYSGDPCLIPGLGRSREGIGYPLQYSWASLVAHTVKNPPAMQETPVQFLGQIPWRRARLPTAVFLGFPGGSAGKESTYNVGRPGFDPWVGKIPWRRLPTPIFWPGEFHGLYIVPGVSKRLSDFHFLRSKGIKSFNMRMSVGGNMRRWAAMQVRPQGRRGG